MQISKTQNKCNPNFGAVQFKTVKAKQKFITELKRQSLADFNEVVNVIKTQKDNIEHICIKQPAKNNQRPDTLNLSAIINGETVEAGSSLVEFLKTCAKIADAHKIRFKELCIKDGSTTELKEKIAIYQNLFGDNARGAYPNIDLLPHDILELGSIRKK